jgi:hypothetical protein
MYKRWFEQLRAAEYAVIGHHIAADRERDAWADVALPQSAPARPGDDADRDRTVARAASPSAAWDQH